MLKRRKDTYRFFVTATLSILLITISVGASYQSNTSKINTSQLTNNPLLISTFLGGGNNDGMYYTGINIIQDKQGNVFIAGTTESTDFPITSGAYSEEHNGNSDLFVTKMNNDLTEVLASTYIGGSNNEEARGIEIDQNSNIFVCGITESSDFPVTTNALQD